MYSNKSFAIVLGDGDDGAGVSRAAIEQYKWCKKNNIEVEVFYYDTGKKYVKRQDLDCQRIGQENINLALNYINTNFDVVIFHSFPRKDAKFLDFKTFYEFVRDIKCNKIAIDHNTTKTSMNFVSQSLLMFNEMDQVYMFEAHSGFGKIIEKLLPSKILGKRLKQTRLWFNFETFKQYFEVPYEERIKRVVYAGRYASFKHTDRTLYLGKALYDVDKSIQTEIHGVTAGISAKVVIFDNPYSIRERYEDKAGSEACVKVFGSYVHTEMMEYLSKSLFGNSFFYYPNQQRFEFQMLEMVACGCVPIFDLQWAKTLTLSTNKTYFDTTNGNGLFFDRNNITKDDIQHLIKVANDSILWNNYRKIAYDIAYKEYNADEVLSKQFNEFASISKDNQRFTNIKNLLEYNIGENIDDLLEAYKNDIVVINASQMQHKNFTILLNKKLKLIKHFK